MSLDSRLRGFHAEDEAPNLAESLATVKAKARRKIIVRRMGMTAIASAVVAAAVTIPIAFSDRETDPITPVPAPSPSMSFHPATPTDRARSIAYVDQKDLWIYNIKEDRATRLTNNGEQLLEHKAAFYGDRYVLYISRNLSSNATAIEAIPLEGGPPVTVVQEQGAILDFDVSPDGATIVYLHTDYEHENTHRLKRVALDGDAPVVLRVLGTPPGRGGGSEDEVSVSLSPDGSSILVTDTHIDESTRSILLLDGSGKDLIGPWSGTHARWSLDGKTIYFRGYAGGGGNSLWRALTVATKAIKTLGLREGSNNLAISPDGTRVAYDTSYFGDTPPGSVTSSKAPIVYVYDLRSGTETALKDGTVFAVWVSPSTLIATDARRPSGPSLNSWEPTGTATKLGLDGTSERVSITSTAWDDAATLFDA